MVEIKFFDQERKCVDSKGFDAGVPDGVEKVEIDFRQHTLENVRARELPDLTFLSNVINRTARMINVITIKNVIHLSPDFLTLFVSSRSSFGFKNNFLVRSRLERV